ncbi:MAG: isoprenylcysteine carboxylmethyltransferase family protein [Desulfobacterales bacterium]|nr:isoprenylcysteine carboxylmethyltransferase family protein [Desulfobacterales bacterium]
MRETQKDITLIVLPVILLLGVIFLGFLRIKREIGIWETIDSLFIVLYIVWILIESRISKKDYNTEDKDKFDSGTCQFYALGQGLTFLTALWFAPKWTSKSTYLLIPFIVFCFGCCFRLWAIRTLGNFYSHKVRRTKDHKIVDSGPYRIIRHPAYTGMILANAGITIYFLNWITLFCFLIVLVPALILRIKVEEKMLFKIGGYSSFALNRKRLFPGIW